FQGECGVRLTGVFFAMVGGVCLVGVLVPDSSADECLECVLSHWGHLGIDPFTEPPTVGNSLHQNGQDHSNHLHARMSQDMIWRAAPVFVQRIESRVDLRDYTTENWECDTKHYRITHREESTETVSVS